MENRNTWALALLAFAMAGCDNMMSGTLVQTLPLSANEGGGYVPVTIALTQDMSPALLSFRAQHGDDPNEIGKWNSYHVTLSRYGVVLKDATFNINHTGSIDSPMGATFVNQPMIKINPPESGDYELRIAPSKPLEVKLSKVEVEVRKNVNPDSGGF